MLTTAKIPERAHIPPPQKARQQNKIGRLKKKTGNAPEENPRRLSHQHMLRKIENPGKFCRAGFANSFTFSRDSNAFNREELGASDGLGLHRIIEAQPQLEPFACAWANLQAVLKTCDQPLGTMPPAPLSR